MALMSVYCQVREGVCPHSLSEGGIMDLEVNHNGLWTRGCARARAMVPRPWQPKP